MKYNDELVVLTFPSIFTGNGEWIQQVEESGTDSQLVIPLLRDP